MIKWPKRIVLIEALALAGAVGWFDYAADWEWSFFAPYAIPMVLTTWQKGWKLGLGISSVCGLVWCLAHFSDNPYQSGWGFALAVAGWWFDFSVLVVAVAAVKDRLEVDRERLRAEGGSAGGGRPFYASPVLANGRLYTVGRRNGTFVLAAGRVFRLIANNHLEGDNTDLNATPAIVGRQRFLRSNRALYGIEEAR
jgi:hypothetical protein